MPSNIIIISNNNLQYVSPSDNNIWRLFSTYYTSVYVRNDVSNWPNPLYCRCLWKRWINALKTSVNWTSYSTWTRWVPHLQVSLLHIAAVCGTLLSSEACEQLRLWRGSTAQWDPVELGPVVFKPAGRQLSNNSCVLLCCQCRLLKKTSCLLHCVHCTCANSETAVCYKC